MATKQMPGTNAPDAGQYICFTDGVGNLLTVNTSSGSGTKITGNYASDGSRYVVVTNGTGTLT